MTAAATAAVSAALLREGPRAALHTSAAGPQWAAVGRTEIPDCNVSLSRAFCGPQCPLHGWQHTPH
jgi:hypothetical protein